MLSNQFKLASSESNPVYQINKYLEPVAGVLEYVLTSEGADVLTQV